MQAISEFFLILTNVISKVIDFVVKIFMDLYWAILALVTSIAQLPNYFSWLPAEVSSLILVIFGVVLVYKIIGREG